MICLEHLTKKFGKETAVADFSIEIREGSIFWINRFQWFWQIHGTADYRRHL